jgi:hypothetical protein
LFRQYKIRYLPQILHFICATPEKRPAKKSKSTKLARYFFAGTVFTFGINCPINDIGYIKIVGQAGQNG